MRDYVMFIPFAVLMIGVILMRLIALRHKQDLPLFYFGPRQSRRLDAERLQTYRRLRKVGFLVGFSVIGLGLVYTLSTNAPIGLSTAFNTVGLMIALSSGFYLEYCIATGRANEPLPD